MTDYEKLRALFTEFGIGYDQGFSKDSREMFITLEAKCGAKVDGYSGFVADFVFDECGGFDRVGVWE